MRLVKNSVQRYIQKPGIDGMYEMIRDNAAVCYQTDVEKMKLSPKDFVHQVLLANAHTRPLEFGTVYLKLPSAYKDMFCDGQPSDTFLTYSKFRYVADWDNPENSCWYVTTNFRCIMQGGWETDEDAFEHNYNSNYLSIMEKYWCEPTEFHYNRYCYGMIASRGVTDDLRTHITLSSLCESTRFCNYFKGKFGNELTFIQPYWVSDENTEKYLNGTLEDGIDKSTLDELKNEEASYLRLAELGLQPQQLKRVFPLGGKAELRLCGFLDSWENFFWRRCDSHADPEAIIIANMIKDDMLVNKIL
jgi:thymidylate synthase (FAD)